MEAGELGLGSGSPGDDVSGSLYSLGLYLTNVLVVGEI